MLTGATTALADNKTDSILDTKPLFTVKHNDILHRANDTDISFEVYDKIETAFQEAAALEEAKRLEELYAPKISNLDIIKVALGEVGYKEKASNSMLDSFEANAGNGNYTKYGQWYGMNGLPWCNIFVAWCANESGCIDEGIIPKIAAVASTWNWYKSRGLTHLASDKSYVPKPGDLAFRGPGNHVEIVEKYEDGILWTIGGNTSGGEGVVSEGYGVYHKKYSNPAKSWYGYASPQYPVIYLLHKE